MAKPKVILYIAVSLDGFIAGKDDDISWLDAYQSEGEDYGYSAFMDTVGAAIMGARTYDESLKHPERLLKGIKTYVLSKQQPKAPSDGSVEFYNGELVALIRKIEKENGKNVYVVGGGQVISSFLNAKLLDELRLFIIPILLHEGIPLFTGLSKETKLDLLDVQSYKSGIVQLHYKPR